MPPKKRQHTGGHDREASTSRGASGSSRNDPIDEYHPAYYGINMPSPSARKRWDRLVRLKHRQCRFLDRETCQAMGIVNDVVYLAERAGLYGVMTGNFLAYRRLTLEFLSTVQVHKTNGMPSSLSFQLKNQPHDMTINELNGVIEGVSGSNCSVDRTYTDDEIWAMITDASVEAQMDFNPTKSKASSIRNPAFRYFHRLLTFTIHVRSNAGTCLAHDIPFITAGITGHMLNAGYFLAQHFQSQSEVRGNARICVGAFVTPIADYFDVEIDEEPISYEIYLDKSSLYTQTFLKRDPRRLLWILHQKDGECYFPLPNVTFTEITTEATKELNWNMSSNAHKAMCTRVRTVVPVDDEDDSEEAAYEEGGEIPAQSSSGSYAQFDTRLGHMETRLDGIDATQTQILHNQSEMMRMMQQWQQWRGFYPPLGSDM